MNNIITAEDYISSSNVEGLVNLGIDRSSAARLINLEKEIQHELESVRVELGL